MADSSVDEIMVRARRPFEGAEGYKDDRSPPFAVSRLRAAELRANGLVEEEPPLVEAKQAPEPENKMAPIPDNKVKPVGGLARKA